MGMYMTLISISDENIDYLLENPPLIWYLLEENEKEAYFKATGKRKKSTWLSRLFGTRDTGKSNGEGLSRLEYKEGEAKTMDLDKFWQAIHFLLTGSQWEGDPPLNFLLAGGTPVGDIDIGHGPARVLRNNELADVNRELSKITNEEFKTRYDPGLMRRNSIYPRIWDSPPEDILDFLIETFIDLKSFIKDAVSKRFGLVIDLH